MMTKLVKKATTNLNELKINEIKDSLINQSEDIQISTVKYMINILTKENENEKIEVCAILINTDIIEVLCRVLYTTNKFLIKDILICLQIIFKCGVFIDCNKSNLVVESITRVIHVSLLTKNDDGILSDCLQVIKLSLIMIKNIKASSSVVNVPLIVNMLSKIVQHNSLIISVSKVSLALLELKGIRNSVSVILPLLCTIISTLSENKNSEEEQLLNIKHLSILGRQTMNILFYQNDQNLIEKGYNKAFKMCLKMTVEILVPYLMKIDKEEMDMKNIMIILTEIHSLFLYSDKDVKFNLSLHLAKIGFIDILQKFEYGVKCNEESNWVRSVLTKIMTNLCRCQLGKENWKAIFKEGLRCLPLRSCFTNLLLELNSKSSLMAIAFNYFNFIFSKRSKVDINVLSEISSYITKLTTIPSSPFTKAIWLIFAVAYFNKKEETLLIQTAMRCLQEFITTYNIYEVFTKHIAILYWAFSSPLVEKKLKVDIINLWLEHNDEEALDDLKSLLVVNKDIYMTVLEILATSNNIKNYDILEKLLFKDLDSKNEIIEDTWSLLPKVLSECLHHSKAKNLLNLNSLIKICMLHHPKKLETTIVLKLSFLLPEVIVSHFKKTDLNLEMCEQYIVVLNFLLSVLEIGIEFKEQRVFLPLLGKKKFLELLELNLFTNNKMLLLSVLHLLYLVIEFQEKTETKGANFLNLEIKNIERMLCTDAQVAISVLKLFAMYFNAIEKPMVRPILILQISYGSLQELISIYTTIHMVSFMSEEVSGLCWICLLNLLQYSKCVGIQDHLAGLPYTALLLQAKCSPSSRTCEHKMEFLSLWITYLPPYSKNALKETSAQKTILKIAKMLLNQSRDRKQRDICSIFAKKLCISALPKDIELLLKCKFKK